MSIDSPIARQTEYKMKSSAEDIVTDIGGQVIDIQGKFVVSNQLTKWCVRVRVRVYGNFKRQTIILMAIIMSE